MRTRTRQVASALRTAALAAGLTLLVLPLAQAGATEAETVSPLPSSDYGARSVCAPPTVLGRAGCLAMRLVPETAEARAHTHPLGMARPDAAKANVLSPREGGYGLRPKDLHTAYALPTESATPQTIALVDAYNDPTAEEDLNEYSSEFGLPLCTEASGCFKQVNEQGGSEPPFPKTAEELELAQAGSPEEQEKAEDAEGWGVEISLDIEAAHATCQNCHIVLVEASSTFFSDLETGVQTAATDGELAATEISNSWGGPECEIETSALRCVAESPVFDHPGIVITASAGDSGYLNWDARSSLEKGFADFPASSPDVVAVGGTRLNSQKGTGAYESESVWNGKGADGGGCSVQFAAPAWQQSAADWSSVGCGSGRAVSDVSADADPFTGIAVHDTSAACEEPGGVPTWCTIGGTSLASPLIAAVFALAGGAHGETNPAQTLYQNAALIPSSLHDVTSGSNGECLKHFGLKGVSGCETSEEAANCGAAAICLARGGYDGPTGVGTPDGLAAFEPSVIANNGGGSGGGGSQPQEGVNTGPAQPLVPSAVPPIVPPAVSPAIQLSQLRLTLKALIALDRRRPKTSQVGFSFTINVATHVRVTLARRHRVHKRLQWQTQPGSLTIAALVGRNSHGLSGRKTLAAGSYRLTLTPVGARGSSIFFQIG